MKPHHWLALIVLCFPYAPAAAGQECGEPAIVNSSKLSSDTNLALNFLKSIVGSVKGVEELVKERDSIFVKFPNGAQGIIVYTMYVDECNLIIHEPTLSFQEKLHFLEELQERLLNRVNGPQPVLTTTQKPLSYQHPPAQGSRYALMRNADEALRVYVDAEAAKSPNPSKFKPPNPSDFVENDNEWLRTRPFQVTNNNKHFVIVDSTPDVASGKVAINILKKRYPQYDFALYPPYGGNTHYGVMLATWVSPDIARRALAAAKTINPKAYIWSCRALGNTC